MALGRKFRSASARHPLPLNPVYATAMEVTAEQRVRRVLAKEGVAFHKYPALHVLEERHGVDLCFSYKTKDSARKLTHYIAENQ